MPGDREWHWRLLCAEPVLQSEAGDARPQKASELAPH
jgi:hypothetical protein